MLRRITAVPALMAAAVAVSLLVPSCSDNPASNGMTDVTMRAEMSGTLIAKAASRGGGSLLGGMVDSIRVTRMRFLVTEMKLHRNKEDSVAGDRTVKIEPFVIDIKPAQTIVFATATIPEGTYDKVKFHLHKAENSDITNPVLADFVTNGNCSTIFDVTVYEDGQAIPYIFRSTANDVIEYSFQPGVQLNAGVATVLALSYDPVKIFKKGSAVLDPRDLANESDIVKAVKDAVLALKR